MMLLLLMFISMSIIIVGLIIHKARNKNGQDIQVRMIGHPQTKRHLETTLPKKVQKWIGM